MTVSAKYAAALLAGRLTPAEQELLLSMTESGKDPGLPGRVWDRVHDLDPLNLRRYLSPRLVQATYTSRRPIASSVQLAEHPDRESLLKILLATTKEQVREPNKAGNAPEWSMIIDLARGMLHHPVQTGLFADLTQWCPRVLWSIELHRRGDVVELLDDVTRLNEGRENERSVTWNSLHVLAHAQLQGRDTEELHRRLLRHEVAPEVYAADPDLLTRSIYEWHEDGDRLVGDVLAAVRGERTLTRYAQLLENADPVIRSSLTSHLKWNAVEGYVRPAGEAEIRERVLSYVAEQLQGKTAAQEVLWGLADEWEGTVGGLVLTALVTTGEGSQLAAPRAERRSVPVPLEEVELEESEWLGIKRVQSINKDGSSSKHATKRSAGYPHKSDHWGETDWEDPFHIDDYDDPYYTQAERERAAQELLDSIAAANARRQKGYGP